MTGLPNTFQVFNTYIDRAMELLTDSEFRVLMYTTRHITGWQDRIDERQGCISISMFEKGFITKDGTRYAGCGLSRQTIVNSIASLVEFGFLERTGKPTSKGQKYTLETKGIDWLALDQRHKSQFEGNKKRTAKANKFRRSGTSDNTGMLDNTMQGTSDNTMLGTLDNTQTNPTSKPSSNPLSAPRPNSRPINPVTPWHDALLLCFNLKPDSVTKSADRTYWTAASEMAAIKFPVEFIPDLYRWCVGQGWKSFSVMAMAKHAGEWLAKRSNNISVLDGLRIVS